MSGFLVKKQSQVRQVAFSILEQPNQPPSQPCAASLGFEPVCFVSKVCHIAVWEKAWENFKEVKWDEVNCTRAVSV